jgi:GNAT superfamily N-acetyltransferase
MKNLLNAITRFVLGLRRPSKAANARRLRKRGETLQSVVIRDATPQDVPALAHLHVKTWRDTYWPVINPPTYQLRERQWREQFNKSDGSWFCLVVENRAGALVGFAKGRRYASDELPGYAGELNKIYVLREYQRLGVGRRLVGHVASVSGSGCQHDGPVRHATESVLRLSRGVGRRTTICEQRRVPRWLWVARFAEARIDVPNRTVSTRRLTRRCSRRGHCVRADTSPSRAGSAPIVRRLAGDSR